MKFDIYVTFPIRFQSTFSVRNYLFFQYVFFIFLPHLTSIVLFLINYSPQYVFWSYFFILHQFTISIIQSVLFFKIEIWKLNLNSECVVVPRVTCVETILCVPIQKTFLNSVRVSSTIFSRRTPNLRDSKRLSLIYLLPFFLKYLKTYLFVHVRAEVSKVKKFSKFKMTNI